MPCFIGITGRLCLPVMDFTDWEVGISRRTSAGQMVDAGARFAPENTSTANYLFRTNSNLKCR